MKRSGARAGKLGSARPPLADIDFRALAAANDLERVTVAKLKEFCAAERARGGRREGCAVRSESRTTSSDRRRRFDNLSHWLRVRRQHAF